MLNIIAERFASCNFVSWSYWSVWYLRTFSKIRRFASPKTLLFSRVRDRAGASGNTFLVKYVFEQVYWSDQYNSFL